MGIKATKDILDPSFKITFAFRYIYDLYDIYYIIMYYIYIYNIKITFAFRYIYIIA